jgi:hypothetical protein
LAPIDAFSVSVSGWRGATIDGPMGESDGVAVGGIGAMIACDGDVDGLVGVAMPIDWAGGEEGGAGGTVIAALVAETASGDADANVGALTHGEGTSAIGWEGTGSSSRGDGGDGGDAFDGDAGGVSERAMATKSSVWTPSFDGSGSARPAGSCGAACMTGIGSLFGAGTPVGAIEA